MSHFIVVVRLPGSVAEADVQGELEKVLQPFHEFECTGDDDEFVQSVDRTEEARKELSKREDKAESAEDFIEGWFGWKPVRAGEQPELDGEHKYGWCRIESGEVIEAFDRTNPNKKWDWWTVGGRWSGYFPVKTPEAVKLGRKSWTMRDEEPEAGHADMVRKRDLDLDLIATKTRESIEKFHAEWERFIAGEKFTAFEGPEDKARRIGLLVTRQGPPLQGEEDRAIPWSKLVQPGDNRADWHYVWTRVSLEDLFGKYADAFSPISGYAYLDETGWHEPGRMGWWGCSSDTPETLLKNKRSFTSWLKETPDDAWLVAVDCHI